MKRDQIKSDLQKQQKDYLQIPFNFLPDQKKGAKAPLNIIK